MRTKPSRGSHLPVLMKLFSMTKGPILELGSGMYSTPYLHWACYPTKRRLVTYEDHLDWIGFAKQFENDYHKVHLVENWSNLILTDPWSIAFVDHDPMDRHFRVEEVKLLTHAEYVVCHDAENQNDRKYKYSTAHDLFKYRTKYSEGGLPYTAIFSNKHDLSEFKV